MQRLIANHDTAVVETTAGKIRGFIYDDTFVFKGVPYGTAKRFHAPEPPQKWDGVKETTSYGYVCPLMRLELPRGELNTPHRYWVMGEDCLNLNIWTPGCDAEARPVLVWLHGGGFSEGSSIEQKAYNGVNMSRFGDVVVVSINHRLNILGYFDLSDYGEEYANSANAGTDDIILALKWVRENIRNFGGNPDNVTVFGQSGGGAKVTALMQSPAADGLFHRAVNMSGVYNLGGFFTPESSAKPLVEAVLAELKLNSVKELEAVPYALFAEAYNKVLPALQKAGEYTGCAPKPNSFYRGDPVRYGFREESAHIPLLIGNVYGEFTSAMSKAYNKTEMSYDDGRKIVREYFGEETAEKLLPLFEKAYAERNPVDLLSLDFMFRPEMVKYLEKRTALNNCTYSYFFNRDSQLDFGRPPCHCFDIAYFFHNTETLVASRGDEASEKLERQMFSCLMAFARSGNPNIDELPEWPASTPEDEYTMFFDAECSVKHNHDKELLPLFCREMPSRFMKTLAESSGQIQH